MINFQLLKLSDFPTRTLPNLPAGRQAPNSLNSSTSQLLTRLISSISKTLTMSAGGFSTA